MKQTNKENSRVAEGVVKLCKYCNNNEGEKRTDNNGRRPYCKACRPVHMLIKEYGLTEEEANKEYSKMFCDICECVLERKHRTPRSKRIDHDHETGEYRGILCNSCNVALGLFGDDKERLSNAIKYLENG